MLKLDDPAWAKLIGNIKAVVTSRGEDGDAFASLHRTEQWDFFTTSGFYSGYQDLGIADTQITKVIRNAIDGKPQEKWLDGVFDLQSGPRTFNDILKGVINDRAEHAQTQERGGRDM